MEELGGQVLFTFVRNDAINSYDLIGLISVKTLIGTVDAISAALNKFKCDCPKASAYLHCVLDEINKAVSDNASLKKAIDDAVKQVSALKVTVKNATTLDSTTAKYLDDALTLLANYADGKAKKLNEYRLKSNKCVSDVCTSVTIIGAFSDTDALSALLTITDTLSNKIPGPLGAVFGPYIKFYSATYTAAQKAADGISFGGGDGALNGQLQKIQDGTIDASDCDQVELALGGGIGFSNCKKKLGGVQ